MIPQSGTDPSENGDGDGDATRFEDGEIATPVEDEEIAAFTDGEIAAIRAATPGCHDGLIHLNHAGSSLPPQAVLDAQLGHLRREAEIGGYEAADEATARLDAVYRSIARLIGARPDQIARQEHATAAWNAAFWSIPMRPGQRIVTHVHDYGANVVGFLRARDRFGVAIDRLPSDDDGHVDLDALDRALADPADVALVSLAWIPTSGGLVNPAVEVGRRCRDAGVPFLLDACQAVGHVPIDVGELGCDFLSATGRKFLRGPRGTGFLYASDTALDRAFPSQPDHHGAEWVALDRYEYVAGARRYEHWEYDHAAWLGLGAAVDTTLDLGQSRITATIVDRAEELRRRLVGLGMTVHDLGRERGGIVTASHPDVAATAIRDRLRAGPAASNGGGGVGGVGAVASVRSAVRVNTSTTVMSSARAELEERELPPLLRLSVHCTTTTDELERAALAIRRAIASSGHD